MVYFNMGVGRYQGYIPAGVRGQLRLPDDFVLAHDSR